MKDIADRLALLVCEQCSRNDGESELDFSTRLYSVYNSCYDNISKLEEQKNSEQQNQSYESYLESSK
ncbi:MAG: hypothetical protein K2O91_12010 [Lachnospiraceae bacterium]|nr:hypothetical protein [Lachnospiraceae bacterium]